MDKAMLALLTDAERMLVAETDKAALALLDEDGLSALHDRIRRARSKYVGQYRRGASAKVSSVGGRGKANAQNARARGKAEVFEIALANVSTALAAAARRSAAELKAERIAAARGTSVSGPAGSTTGKGSGPSTAKRTGGKPVAATPARKKKNASTLAAGARRQAKRDSR